MPRPQFPSFLVACTFGLLFVMLDVNASAQDDAVDLIVEFLQDDDQDVRAIALEQIRDEVPGEDRTKTFAALLPELPPAAQEELLSALADRGDSAAAPAVREFLSQTQDADLRIAAMRALGKLGGSEDLPVFLKFLASSSPDEQDAARRSLVLLPGEEASAAIAKTMQTSPTPQRVALIEVLTTRRARNALDEILAAAVADDAAVRSAAMKSLGAFAEPEHVPGMLQGVLKAQPGR